MKEKLSNLLENARKEIESSKKIDELNLIKSKYFLTITKGVATLSMECG